MKNTVAVLVGLMLLLLASCGEAGSPSTETAVPPAETRLPPTVTPIPPTATQLSPTDTPEPTSCEEVEGNCLALTFDGEGCTYEGPTVIKGGQLVRVTVLFFNESEEEAWMNVWRLEGDRTLQDVLDWCEEPCTKNWGVPFWVRGLTSGRTVPPGQRQTWAGLLRPGNHTVNCGREEPVEAWFVAGLTVEE